MFNDQFEGTLDERFLEKLKLDGFSEEKMAAIKDKAVDYITLNKLAIDNSDAIVEASAGINQELIDYALASGKPFMKYPGAEEYVNAYAEFYSSLQQ